MNKSNKDSVVIDRLEPGQSVELKMVLQKFEPNPDRKWWQLWKSAGYWRDYTPAELKKLSKMLKEKSRKTNHSIGG